MDLGEILPGPLDFRQDCLALGTPLIGSRIRVAADQILFDVRHQLDDARKALGCCVCQ